MRDPIADLESELKERVCRKELARLYGLDLARLHRLAEIGEEDAETRAALRELHALCGIIKYFETDRKATSRGGDILQVKIPQLPCRILASGTAKFGSLLRANRKFRIVLSSVGAGVMYR